MLFRGRIVVAILLMLVSASGAEAQDDPFAQDMGAGGGGGIFGGFDPAPPAAAPAGETADEEADVDPFVAQLRRYAAGTPHQLGVAVREAARLRLWGELDRYLTTARIKGLGAAAQTEVAQTVGGALLARAWTEATLGDEAREALRILREAAASAAIAPATLDAAIARLGSASVDDRLGATRTLLRGGEAAVAKLALAASAAEPPAPRERIWQVLRGFGDSAFEAVAQLALYGNEAMRPGALRTLAALDGDRALPWLVSSLHAKRVSGAEREVATAALLRLFPSLPTRHETETYLVDRLRIANEAYVRSDYGFPAEAVWQIDPSLTDVARVVPSGPVAAARRAMDVAAMIRRLGELHPATLSAAVRADLRYRSLIDPVFGGEAGLAALRASWGERVADPDFLSRMLSDAIGKPVGDSLNESFDEAATTIARPPGDTVGDPAAAIAIVRLMALVGDVDVVHTTAANPSPLIAAASHPIPRVRFEAAAAIGALAPHYPYEQSTEVLNRWIRMSQLKDAPLALLMFNDATSARILNAHLDQLGYRVVRVPTASRLVDAVEEGGDLQLIVATTTPPDMVAIEMVDRVRRRPLGGAVPILLVGPPSEALVTVADRWSAPVERMALPQTVAAFAATVRPMLDASPMLPLSAAERQGYAAAGLSILSQLSTEEGVPLPYNLLARQGELIEASLRSGFSGPSLGVLSSLGSQESQSLLATVAANPSLEIAVRQRAAEAFAASVERFGTRLSRQQVAEQYDRFNAATSDEGRAAIGQTLDAMEARVGVSTKD